MEVIITFVALLVLGLNHASAQISLDPIPDVPIMVDKVFTSAQVTYELAVIHVIRSDGKLTHFAIYCDKSRGWKRPDGAMVLKEYCSGLHVGDKLTAHVLGKGDENAYDNAVSMKLTNKARVYEVYMVLDASTFARVSMAFAR